MLRDDGQPNCLLAVVANKPALLATTLGLLMLNPTLGQDVFSQPIQKGSVQARVEDFAVIPDSINRVPARISVMSSDPTGRMFANDQRGPLYHISNDGSNVTEYIDLRDFTQAALQNTTGEQGFQGFAFHPDFNTNGTGGFGKFYTIHSSSNNSPTPDFNPGGSNDFHTVLMEWSTPDPTAATYAAGGGIAPREVMRFQQPFSNHNAGMISFNPSGGAADHGNLYIALGDGGSGGDPQENGQDTGNPYGAILRIDPLGNNAANGNYGIVSENVLAADGNANTIGEIYAYGLRNPQRFSWDSQTGEMYISDIGQNVIEEINVGVNGGNYGWDQREGSIAFEGAKEQGMIDPVAEYDHTNTIVNPPTNIVNRAITIGEVFRGPGAFDGLLMAGDFPTGAIFYLDVDNDPLDGGQDGLFELDMLDANDQSVRLLELINDARAARGLTAVTRADLRLSVGIDGEVYVTNKHDGVIRRLTSVPEPSAALLLLASLCCIARRRNRVF